MMKLQAESNNKIMIKSDKIINYFESTYNLKLDGWQLDTVPQLYQNGKLEDRLRVIIKGPRGMRKSTTVDLLVLDHAIHNKVFVILASVGASQAKEHILYFRTLLREAGLYSDIVDERATATGIEINLENGSRLLCIPQSASSVGFHGDIIYTDELARIDPQFFHTVVDRFSQGKPKCIKIITSTPYGVSSANKNNPFFDIFTQAEKDVKNGKVPKYTPYSISLEQCPWITEQEISEARAHMPDNLFRQEIIGEFVEHLYGLFTILQLENMRTDSISTIHPPLFAGLDLGHKKDFTALVVLDTKFQVLASHRWKGSWEQQISNVVKMVQKYKVSTLRIDTTGIGDPIYEFIRKTFTQMKMGTRLIPFVFTKKSKAQLVNKLLFLAETGQLKIPKVNGKLYEELAHFKFLDEKMVRTGASKGYHDDLLIALGLACINIKESSDSIKILPDIFAKTSEQIKLV